MPAKAKAVHGLSMSDLKGAPTWIEAAENINAILRNKIVLAYSAEYDERLVRQTADMYQVLLPQVERWECVMLQYARFIGEPSPWHRGEFKWQKLPGAAHNALGDCRAALAVIQTMSVGAPVAGPLSELAAAWRAALADPTRCRRCDGRGKVEKFSHIRGGQCFACGGSGKTTPAHQVPRASRVLLGLLAGIAMLYWLLSSNETHVESAAVQAPVPTLPVAAPAASTTPQVSASSRSVSPKRPKPKHAKRQPAAADIPEPPAPAEPPDPRALAEIPALPPPGIHVSKTEASHNRPEL
jgi:hypothetical protein